MLVRNGIEIIAGTVFVPSSSKLYFSNYDSFFQLVGGDLVLDLAAEKTLVFAEPGWRDINLGAALLTTPASSAPSKDEFKDSTGTDTGIETLSFADGDKVSGGFEMQHDYKEGSDFFFHIHWQGITAPSGTDYVKWQIDYTIARDDVVIAPVTTVVVEASFTTQYALKKFNFPNITGTTYKIEDQILFKLSRITASGDAYAGGALYATVGLHYQTNTHGSRTASDK